MAIFRRCWNWVTRIVGSGHMHPAEKKMQNKIAASGHPQRHDTQRLGKKRLEGLTHDEIREVADRLIREHQPAFDWLADK